LRLDPAEPVDVRFERPLFDRIIFPFVLLVMLILVLLLSFIEGTVTFIEGALAVFLGVFGLTQVLLPSSTEVRTIVHLAIWGIYVALAGALLHHMFLQIRTTVDTLVADDEDDQPTPASQVSDTSARPEAKVDEG
jgi:Ni,Fe-hydrogenase I cytochrome b subunit